LVRDRQRDIVRAPGFGAYLKHQFNVAELVLNTGGKGLSGIREDFGRCSVKGPSSFVEVRARFGAANDVVQIAGL
jgi:hypothetical protein